MLLLDPPPGCKGCLAFRKGSVNICPMNDGIRELHGAFQRCFLTFWLGFSAHSISTDHSRNGDCGSRG